MKSVRHCILFVILLSTWMEIEPSLACVMRDGETVPTATIPLKYENRRANVSYHYDLLSLALKKAEPLFGPCEARISEIYLPNTRLNLHSVESGLVDVIDTTTSKERDERLTPIRVPLLKGLMGYRILFIRHGDQARFSAISSLEKFKTLTLGEGADWPDNEILAANGIRFVTSINHHSLMKMLIAHRFDAYPRGAQQILVEFYNRNDKALMVEKNLGLAYVSPVYFHVSKNNLALAKRIQYGLNLAINDGSFDQLFYQHPLVVRAFQELNLKNRHYFYLCNPNLHPDTPLDKPEFWWQPWPRDMRCQK